MRIKYGSVRAQYYYMTKTIEISSYEENRYTIKIKINKHDYKKHITYKNFEYGQEQELIQYIFDNISRAYSIDDFEIRTVDGFMKIRHIYLWEVEYRISNRHSAVILFYRYRRRDNLIERVKRILKSNLKVQVIE